MNYVDQSQAETEFLRFVQVARTGGAVTNRWQVWSKGGTFLGRIGWYTAWRKYCYYPEGLTTYDPNCLRAIATFCESETLLHKERRRAQTG